MSQQPPGTTWYAMPAAGGQEYAYSTPFRAHLKLDQLAVAGDVELYTPANQRRDVVASRAADGTWSLPDDEGDA